MGFVRVSGYSAKDLLDARKDAVDTFGQIMGPTVCHATALDNIGGDDAVIQYRYYPSENTFTEEPVRIDYACYCCDYNIDNSGNTSSSSVAFTMDGRSWISIYSTSGNPYYPGNYDISNKGDGTFGAIAHHWGTCWLPAGARIRSYAMAKKGSGNGGAPTSKAIAFIYHMTYDSVFDDGSGGGSGGGSDNYRYIKFEVLEGRDGTTECSVTGLSFEDGNGNKYSWPLETEVTCNITLYGEPGYLLLDDGNHGAISYNGMPTFIVTLPAGSYIDTSTYTSYSWKKVLGNAYPKSWNLYISKNGTNWKKVDEVSGYVISGDGYSGQIYHDEITPGDDLEPPATP